MSEFYHPILSERPEDQLKAIKWAKEEQGGRAKLISEF